MNARNLLWSNVVIAIAASCTVLTTFGLANSTPFRLREWAFALGIGAATWIAYTWQRHVKSTRSAGLRPDHLDWHERHEDPLRRWASALLPVALLPVALTLESAQALGTAGRSWIPLALLLASVTATALYAGLPGEQGKRRALRRIPGVKMVWIAGSWASITALWPLWWSSGADGLDLSQALGIWGERCLVIAALTLPFDLRDRRWDEAGMRTWPQLLGPGWTRVLGVALVTLAASFRWTQRPEWGISGLAVLAAMACAVSMARENRTIGYYGLLDALLIADALWMGWVLQP